jgi:hypothetical protein
VSQAYGASHILVYGLSCAWTWSAGSCRRGRQGYSWVKLRLFTRGCAHIRLHRHQQGIAHLYRGSHLILDLEELIARMHIESSNKPTSITAGVILHSLIHTPLQFNLAQDVVVCQRCTGLSNAPPQTGHTTSSS